MAGVLVGIASLKGFKSHIIYQVSYFYVIILTMIAIL